MNRFIGSIILLLLLLGCENPKIINSALKNAIAEYYETSDISIMYIGKNTIKISISNSNFIKEKENTSRGWGALKPYASIGAMIVYDYHKKNGKIFENIVINIDNTQYEYSIENIEEIFIYYEVCNLFLEKLNDKDINGVYNLIYDKISLKDKEHIYLTLSSFGEIDGSKIIAYDIQEDIYTIYINSYMENNYITIRFSFLGNDKERKIVGINTVD